MSYLTNWLINHICKIDHKLGDFIQDQQRKFNLNSDAPPATFAPAIDTRQESMSLSHDNLVQHFRQLSITLQLHRELVSTKVSTHQPRISDNENHSPGEQIEMTHACGSLLDELEACKDELNKLLGLLQNDPDDKPGN
ncbi:MAG: hypothetical protein H6999_12435 [Hahellaceae bacterium]|nr:hypothetical protein [Hahellaceae bacterium]MCP5170550.1 hypothetical protein [Hahellaceae bacterium]